MRRCGLCTKAIVTSIAETFGCSRECAWHAGGAIFCSFTCCEVAHAEETCHRCGYFLVDPQEHGVGQCPAGAHGAELYDRP